MTPYRTLLALLLGLLAAPAAPGAPADDLLAKDASGRLSSALHRLARAEARGQRPDWRDAGLLGPGGREVAVIAELREAGAAPEVERFVREQGGREVASAGTLLRADLPLGALVAVAGHPDVLRLRRPRRPERSEVVSAGVGLLRADAFVARTGADGTGVRVGVMDSDFKYLDDALGRELPKDTIVTESVRTVPEEKEDHGHGTACAEIVHDMAPGATLVLAKVGDEVRFLQALEQLQAQGVQVISASFGYPNVEDLDGQGYYAWHAERATRQAVWANAAGNYAEAHHEGTAQDADGNGILEFRGVELLPIEVPKGSSWVSLKWDEPRAKASEDYDLLVVTGDFAGNPDTSAGNPAVVAVSADPQDGDDWAYEHAELESDERRRLYVVVVKRGSKVLPATRRFSIMLRGWMDPAFNSPQSTLTSPADARGVVAVAAIDAESGLLRGYSSRGPTADGRTKPDLAGPDGVWTWTYSLFTGTSAATPHVAGAAALILSREPKLTPAELREKLMNSAGYPSGTANNDVGYGLVNLDRLP